MKVTVLMVTYNHEAYIKIAIESIFQQTFIKKFDFIISDDFSTDSTTLIIKETIKNVPEHINVKFYAQKKNLGGVENFNFCLSKISEGLVIIADGDDKSKNNRIDFLYNLHINLNKDLYISNAEEIDENNISLQKTRYFKNFKCENISYNDLYTNKIPVFGAGYAFDYRIIKKFGLIDSVLVTKNNIDQIFFWRAFLGLGCYYVHEPLLYYRVHSQSTSLSKQRDRAYKNNMFLEAKLLTIFIHLNMLGNIVYIIQSAIIDLKLLPLFEKFKKEFNHLQEQFEDLKKLQNQKKSIQTIENTINTLSNNKCDYEIQFGSFKSIYFNGKTYDMTVKSLKKLSIIYYIDALFLIFTGQTNTIFNKKHLYNAFNEKKFTKLEFALVMMKKYGIYPMPFTDKLYMTSMLFFKWFKIKQLEKKLFQYI